MRFVVSQSFFDRIPDAIFALVAIQHLDNRELNPAIEKRLRYQIQQTRSSRQADRQAALTLYQTANQTLALPATLTDQVADSFAAAIQTVMPPQNALLDLVRLVTLNHAVAISAYPWSTTDQLSVQLMGKPQRFGLQAGAQQLPLPWVAQPTLVDEQTKQALIIISGFEANRTAVLAAQTELSRQLVAFFGQPTTTGLVSRRTTAWPE